MLAGHPDPQVDRPEVVVYPGTVVLPGESAAEKAHDYQHVIDELAEAYRLAELRPDRWKMLFASTGESHPVPGLEGGPTVQITLLHFDDARATYRVRLSEGEALLAEPTITVHRGERAIVGTRDGAAAPYLFLLVEPLPPSQGGVLPGHEPKKIHHVNPSYPQAARKAGVGGVVLLDCRIDEVGLVRDVNVIHGEPLGLTEAAIAGVSQWRYEPPRGADGEPAPVWMTVTVRFRLN